jgi:HK97 family phage portal protein
VAVPTLRERVGLAIKALRGGITAPDASRAVIPLVYPNFPGLTGSSGQPPNGLASGTPQMSLVRTANPQEYKPEGASIRAEGFSKHPVVHACMRVIADTVASVPLIVLRARGDYESRVPESHPLQRLLDYPGPRFTARTMRARLAIDFLGYGNAMLEMDRGPSGQGLPRRLGSINPESLQSVWVDTEGDPRRYDYANWSGIIVQRDVADIIHVRDLEMPRPFTPDAFGFPRGATALASIAADNEATKYVRQVVTNDGTPTFAVLLADEATQDDATAMQDRYRARVVDRGKRGTPAFFGAVKDIKPLGFTLSDLEFPDLRRVSREDICAAFGVDPRMIGIASATSDAGLSGAQYVEARARLVQHTIEPMLAAIEDELNHWLAPEFGDVWISYDHDMLRELVEDDERTSTRVRAEFRDGLRTWEESRRALRLSPIPEPTDTILITAGSTLTPAAVAVIDPRAVMEQAPAQDGPPPALQGETDVEEMEDEDEPEDEDDDLEEDRADATDFPAKGDNKAVSLRNSQWARFPVGEAEALKADFPEIWRKGGNVRGNRQFAILAPLAKRGGSPNGPAEERAVRLREAWGARHRGNKRIAGVIAQVKWLVIGDIGLDGMRAVINEAKEALGDRAAERLSAGRAPVSARFAVSPMETVDAPPASAGEALRDASPLVDEQGRPWWVHHPEVLRAPLYREDGEPNEDHILYRYWVRQMEEMDRQEAPFYRAARERFREDAKDVAAMFATATRADDPVLDAIERQVREKYAKGGDYYAAWRAAYLELIERMYLFGAQEVMGAGYSFGLKPPSVLQAIANRADRLAELIGETTAKQVTAAIRSAELAELSVAETARLIQASVYGEQMTDVRATRIAKTEVAGAQSQGSWDQAKAEGDLFRAKQWLAFEDRKTRPTHRDDGNLPGPIGIDDRFPNTGLLYPLDPSTNDPANTINCRCTLVYYTETPEEAQGVL